MREKVTIRMVSEDFDCFCEFRAVSKMVSFWRCHQYWWINQYVNEQRKSEPNKIDFKCTILRFVGMNANRKHQRNYLNAIFSGVPKFHYTLNIRLSSNSKIRRYFAFRTVVIWPFDQMKCEIVCWAIVCLWFDVSILVRVCLCSVLVNYSPSHKINIYNAGNYCNRMEYSNTQRMNRSTKWINEQTSERNGENTVK